MSAGAAVANAVSVGVGACVGVGVFVGVDLVSGEDVSSTFFVGVAVGCAQLVTDVTMMERMRRRTTMFFFTTVLFFGCCFNVVEIFKFLLYKLGGRIP